jgi:RNA polymerase sigma-70 factor (sigma-E family)
VIAEVRREGAPRMQDPVRRAFEAHYGRLVRLAALLLGRSEGAEDLAQDAFVKAAMKIEALPDDEVGPYLRRVLLNLWKNRLRRLAVERRFRFRVARPDVEQPGTFEERDAMWRAVQALPSRQRACLVLRYYEDLSERTVAEIMGCSVGTVKSQTSRGLARLRKELGSED